VEELKGTIAKNIVALRKKAKLTQLELAQKLNYSDKAVSKWERAESVPDVGVLKAIAELFGVSVDYLLADTHEEKPEATAERKRVNRLVVSLLAVALVWLIATVVFVVLKLYPREFAFLWTVYVYAIPVSCVVLLVFNSLWGSKRLNYVIISLLLWSLIGSVYIGFYKYYDLRLLFVIGIPAQIIIILWSYLRRR